MDASKLRRIESPVWQPPLLLFDIERHGATVKGSSRAIVYTWSLDTSSGRAGVCGEKSRQLYAQDKRLDVKPIAADLAEAIIAGRIDMRFEIAKDGSVRLQIGLVSPTPPVKQTTDGGRRR